MTRKGCAPVWPIALALALLDAGARALMALRLDRSGAVALLALPAAFALLWLLLSSAHLARRDGLAMAVPIAGLLTLGDIVAARMAGGHAGWRTELPAVGSITIFVLALGGLRDLHPLSRAGERLGVLGAVLIALPLAPFVGHTIGGQAGWIDIGWQVAPGELGRPLVLLGLAAGLARRLPSHRDLSPGAAWPAVRGVLLVPCVAVATHLVEADFGPALLLALAVVGVVAIALGALRWFVLALAGALGALVAAAAVLHRLGDRVLDVAHPLRMVGGQYDQAALAHLALSWGGWTGVGFGGGLTEMRRGAIPAASTDYVLAGWTLETGAVGLLVAMALFTWLLATAWTWTLRAPDAFPRLAAAGLTWLLTISTIWTTGAVLGMLPLSGLPSPFVSGASNAIALGACAAVLCRVDASAVVPSSHLARARAVRLGRLVAVSAPMVIAVLAAGGIAASRTRDDRLERNPLLMWSALQRGPIASRDGTTLAVTVDGDALDRIERRYPLGGLVDDIVGRVGFGEQTGGIENAWRGVLRCGGSDQSRPSGRGWSGGGAAITGDPASCRTAGLRVTLDVGIQRAVQHAFRDVAGAAIVLDGRSGAILAAGGRYAPAADHTERAPFDLAVAPGSTFKIVTGAAALMAHVPTDTPAAAGFASADGRWLPNAAGEVCGGSFQQAFVSSCNSSFARLGTAVGIERLRASAARFGFGQALPVSGLEIASSSLNASRRPDPAGLAATSIGQAGVVATPLQMALVAATVASGGRRPQPILVEGICGGASLKASAEQVIPGSVAAILRDAMRETVLRGTAEGAADLPGAWAAKTGTAELPALRQTGSPRGTAGWIVGFATRPGPSGIVPVVAGIALPDRAHASRSGPLDGVALLRAVAHAALAAHGSSRSCG